MRKQLHLRPDDSLEIESIGDDITLRPVHGTGLLTKEDGVWVFYSDEHLPTSATDDVLQQTREERDLVNLGKGE